jgi:hypothetical protein
MLKKVKSVIKEVYPLSFIWRKIDWLITKNKIKKDIRIIPNSIYKKTFGKNINWNNPKTLIEKIYWMQLYTDTSLWTLCADKYAVRQFVLDRGCGEALNTIYGKWDNATQINWDELPNSFVLKTNNACGQIVFVKDKNKLNIPQTINKLNNWLDAKYGYRDAQFHYTKIKPCIIAEKLLENVEEKSSPLIDYKVWCFNGKPESIIVVHSRTKNSLLITFFDLEWNNITKYAINNSHKRYSDIDLPKPHSLSDMIKIAEKLSEGIPQVRVDFYEINRKAVFGEMTFTTGFGALSSDYYNYLGSKIDLQKVEKLNNIISPLN